MNVLIIKGDSKPLMVLTPEDVFYAVENHCGDEIARYLRELFEKFANRDRAIELKLATDLVSYESQLESNTAAFLDILAEVENLEKEVRQPRLNREILRKKLAEIKISVNNQI